MKTFPANFATEIAKKTGIAPVWILKLTVGGVDYYLSDNAFTVAGWNGGVTTVPWIGNWGQVYEQMSGAINEIRVADMQVECVVDPDAATSIMDLAMASDLEKSPAILYLWLHGLDASTDPPQEMVRFYVRDVDLSDEQHVSLVLEDATVRLTNIVGEVVKVSDWPNVDPDDVGKIFPLPYGTVRNLPSRGTVAGLLTTLKADITAGATTCQVARPDGIMANSTVFRIESEDILVTAVSGDQLTITRGYNGTTAASHSAGDRLLERVSSPFVFVVSSHELTAIDKVCVLANGETEVDITDQCTRYTGATGNQYSGYGSRAVITISQAQADIIQNRVLKAASLTLNDPNHQHAASNQVMTVKFDDISAPSGSWFVPANYVINGDLNDGGICESYSSYGDTIFSVEQPVSGPGTPVRYRFAIRHGGDATYNNGVRYWYYGMASFANLATSSSKTTHYSGWKTDVTSWSQLNSKELKIAGGVSGRSRVWEIWIEVEYDPSTSTGSTGITGNVNSVADAILGGPVHADVTAPDTAPADVVGDVLSTWSDVSTTTVDGTMPAGYSFDGAIIESIRLVDLVSRLAFQCRSFFRIKGDEARLIVRPDTLTSEKTIPACRIQSGSRVYSRRKTEPTDILNVIDVRFKRDWTVPSQSVDAYLEITSTSDATSIADYGKKEQPSLFQFDFVTDSAMAVDLRDFYLAEYKRRKWLHEFEVFLDHAELEFGDGATLGFSGNTIVELMQVGFAPGTSDRMDVIRMIGRG